MTDIDLPAEALDVLKRLAKGPGSLPASPDTAMLWEIRYVMGSPANAHITSRGKSFILKLMETNSPDDMQLA
jgi:hypothetical protein